MKSVQGIKVQWCLLAAISSSSRRSSSVSKIGNEKVIIGGVNPSTIRRLMSSSRTYIVGDGRDLMGNHWTLISGEQYCRNCAS